ncbi:MAG: hypothetical protein C0392_15060 [Syntrophus sp. (in: bacteria)]|nr:hypothetical protein [Syntrophus sp. (in: bacteria)]
MKRFIRKFLLFLTPFAALIAIEILVLPIDFFTFRVWEALKIDSFKKTLPGYFYPSMKVSRIEEGDLAFHSPLAIKRHVEWETDRYGYRNRNSAAIPSIVIIGDSNTVGTGLTQKEALSEALGNTLNADVYSFAPAGPNAFLKESRFIENPPPIVVVAAIEREITLLPRIKRELAFPLSYEKAFIRFKCAIKETPLLQGMAVPLDRAIKGNMLHYVRAYTRRTISIVPAGHTWNPEKQGPFMRFVVGDGANNDIPKEQFDEALRVIVFYNKVFQEKGIRFIFLPIPNKENIYYELLPSKKKPVFLRQLIDALKSAGVETMDTQKAFEEAHKKGGELLFQTDDSHWSRRGVQIAASLLAEAIKDGR